MDAQTLRDRIKEQLRERIREMQRAGVLKGKSASLSGDLLDSVHLSDKWTLFLTREQACTLCRVKNWASARRNLSALQDAGLISLHTNNCAYIVFLRVPTPDLERAESARERAETARQESADLTDNAESARVRAESARVRAESARVRALSGTPRKDQEQQEGRNNPSSPDPDPSGGAGGAATAPKVRDSAPKVRDSAPKVRDDQPAAGPPRIPPAEQARSVRLLTDPEVGLYPKLAGDAAERYGFREIAAQVFRYLRDRAARTVRSPGCIPQRLARPDLFPARLEYDDLEDALWLRHASEDDLAWAIEERGEIIRRKYIPDEYADIILG